jgi:hypothetical protein
MSHITAYPYIPTTTEIGSVDWQFQEVDRELRRLQQQINDLRILLSYKEDRK